MPFRDLYVDRLRVAMTAIVIVFHCAITYGSAGSWFYQEIHPSQSPSSLLMTLFVVTNQAYFMGFFFLLAGYFTPGSLERKGYARFLADRFLRLGLPLLAFGLLLGPLTVAMVNHWADGGGFWTVFESLWRHKHFINGPLWFAEALLIFTVGYCVWRAAAGAPLAKTERVARPVPGFGWWLLSAVGVGAAAFAIRLLVPSGVNVFGMQLGYFAGYIFLFALGAAAWRSDWLRQLEWKHARPWIVVSAVVFLSMPVVLAVADPTRGTGEKSNFMGGLSWQAAFYAFWEPFVAWGVIPLWLLAFRAWVNQPSGAWAWLSRRAYAVYIIHPVVLVGVSLLLRGWVAPALVKWGVVGPLACVACWLASDPLVRLPGVRRVV